MYTKNEKEKKMAFKKQEFFVYEDITKNGNTDDVLSIPLVIMQNQGVYQGFVPGFVMKDIIDEDLEECKKKLVEHTKKVVKTKVNNNQVFPFFPTNEEIKKDFKNVVLIKRVNIKVK